MRDTIERNGRTYRVTVEHDDTMGAPWMNEDGHGHISDWTSRDKQPGERLLAGSRHGRKRFYDIAETIRLATLDGWGLGPRDLAALAARARREPTRKQIVAEAVRLDFERMRGWCNDEWHYVGVIVELLDDDGDGTGEAASLWGIESDAGAYLDEVAADLVDELDAPLLAADIAALEASRPDLYEGAAP